MSLIRHVFKRALTIKPLTDEKVLFLHVPKCGGTSIDNAIKNGFTNRLGYGGKVVHHLSAKPSEVAARRQDLPMREFRDHVIAYFTSFSEARYVSGHFRFTNLISQLVDEGWHVVTVLRDPVSKWLSQFFYNKFKESDHFRIEQDLGDFLQTSRAQSMGLDYVKVFAPEACGDGPVGEEQIEAALENLRKCSLVGSIEDLTPFVASWEKEFKYKLKISHRNANPIGQTRDRSEVTDSVMAEIERLCEPNMRIYKAMCSG